MEFIKVFSLKLVSFLEKLNQERTVAPEDKYVVTI